MAHACGCQHGSTGDRDGVLAPVRSDETVAEVVQRHAGALQIMKRMGINHCCGAGLTLAEAAAAAGVPLEALIATLNEERKAPA